MPMVDADWQVTGLQIRYIGDAHAGVSPSYATVIEFHRWVQDLADDGEAAGDDIHDITDLTATDRSTNNVIRLINGYNIDDTAAEHLYNGSIEQADGDTLYSGLVVVGAVETGTELEIIQDGALLTRYWTDGLNVAGSNILRIMIKTRENGADIDGKRLRVQSREFGDTYSEFEVTAGEGNSTAAIFSAADLNNATAQATVAAWDQFANVEGYQLLDITGDTVGEPYYSQWQIGGGTTPASPDVNDLYEWTKNITRRGTVSTIHGINGSLFRGPTHDVTYDTLSGSFTEDNYAVWGTEIAYDGEGAAGLTVGEYYEFSDDAYATIKAVGKLNALDDNGVSGFAIFALEAGGSALANNDVFRRVDGTVNDDAVINVTINDDGAAGGRGLVLADEGATQLYIQLIDGEAPVDNLPMWDVATTGVYDNATSGNALVNVTVTSRTISPEFLGTSTGAALIGAYGIGLDPTDAGASDQFFDLDNVLRQPPNNVTLSVIGCVIGESRVLVGPEDGGGGLDKAQFTVAVAALTGAAVTSIEVNAAIPSDLPSSGTLRVVTNGGFDRLISYTSYTGAVFTIASTNFTGDNASIGNGVYVTAIDKLATQTTESATYVYGVADRVWFLRVRDGGAASPEKTFETTITVGAGGGSANVIHTPDI